MDFEFPSPIARFLQRMTDIKAIFECWDQMEFIRSYLTRYEHTYRKINLQTDFGRMDQIYSVSIKLLDIYLSLLGCFS